MPVASEGCWGRGGTAPSGYCGARLCGVRWTIALGEELGRARLPDSRLQEVADAVASAVLGWRLRFYNPCVSPWELMLALTGGLLHGPPRDRPSY